MVLSGIDLHKRTITIQTVDATGVVVRAVQLAARHDAPGAYFATLPGPDRAAVECSGMWYWVRDPLAPQGIDLRLGHAKYLKAIIGGYPSQACNSLEAGSVCLLIGRLTRFVSAAGIKCANAC